MSEYEQEVVALIKFKAGSYPDRQDYLAALLRATDKWLQKHDSSGNIFDGWDDALAAWFDDGIHAMNAKRPIPDFPDAELGDENAVPDEEEEADDGADPEAEPNPEAEADHTDDQADSTDSTASAGTVPEAVSAPTPRITGAVAEPAPGKVPPRVTKPKKVKTPTRYDNLSGAKDRYGIIIGTKTHDVLKLYEKGTTSKEIDEKVGGRHYNVLKQMAKAGHLIERLPGGGFKLTHRDDLTKSKEVKSDKDE